MRGKLRDKRAKHDVFRHEVAERKRPSKRETRMAILLDQELDEQDTGLEEEPEKTDEELSNQPLIRITQLTQK